MKNILLFLVFLLVGLALLLGYRYLSQPQKIFQNTKPPLTTKFSLAHAPTQSFQGTIASMSGKVMWLSRTASKPVQLKSPRAIQQGEELSTGSDGQAIIRIQNDASLLLLPNSHVSIIQLLPQNFVFVQDRGTIRYENTIQVPVSIKTLDLLSLLVKGVVTIYVDPHGKTVSANLAQGDLQEGYEDAQNNSTTMTVNEGQTFIFDQINKIGTIQ
jgi:hypothetical protein